MPTKTYLIAILFASLIALNLTSSAAILPEAAASTALLVTSSNQYNEEFTNYTHKAYTTDAVWDIWQGHVRLARPDAVSQSVPAIARDSSDNLLLVWSDYRNGNSDIYAQKVDGQGNRLWAQDVRVNSDTGTSWQYYPAITSDSSGNLLLVWSDERNGNLDIYAQKINSQGNHLWAQDVFVNSDTGTANQYAAAITSDSSGNLLLVWSDERNGNLDIYAQKVDSQGNRLWGQDVRVNSDTGTTSQDFPAIASDSSGNLLLVWQDRRNGNLDIYAQKVDSQGNLLWGQDVRVNSDVGTAWQESPTVASDSSGNLLLAWDDTRDGNGDIYAQKFSSNGSRMWAQDVRINSDMGTVWQESPTIASDSSGNLLLVWSDERNGNRDIYAQKFGSNGIRLWAQDVRVSSDTGTASQYDPAIAPNSNGNLLLVWMDYRNGNTDIYNDNADIYAQRIDSNGNRLWTQDVHVNGDTGKASQNSPAIASDGSGNLLLVWQDARNGNYDIYAQKVDSNGNRLWAQDVRVNSNMGTTSQYNPAITRDSSGNLLLVWLDGRNGDYDIYAQKIDSLGNRLWAQDVRVNSDTGMANQYSPAIASDSSGNLLLAWGDYRDSNSNIYAQKVDSQGNRLWAQDVHVSNNTGTTWEGNPAITSDGSGNLLLVWVDERNGNLDTYAQKINSQGNRLWVQDVRVNSDTGTVYQDSPAITSDSSGNLLLVWQDYRNGHADIYAQKVSSIGNRLWVEDARINSDTGTAWQESPTIASDSSGNLLLAWGDSRNGNRDVYAQKANSNGNRLWAQDMRVNSDMDTTYQDDPAVTSDSSGNLLLAWSDSRNGNGDIYAQKLGGSGNKLWVNDLQVVYPDLFYLETGVVESRTVNTGTTAIAQAQLSATAQLNGGTIRYYLSNNGGQDWAEVTPGVLHVFTTSGSDLRWRLVLTADASRRNSPIINNLQITYDSVGPAWTMLVYMACDSDINSYCEQAFSRLQLAAANPHLQVIVLWDKFGLNNTYRYLVQPNGQYSDGVNRWYLGELDTANQQTLSSFVSWALDNYPTPHNYLSIIDHGLGHVGVAWDYQTNPMGYSYMKPNQVEAALEQATINGDRRLDILHFDACSMGLLEQAYQYKEFADILIASQSIVFATFPYNQYGTLFTAEATPRAVATGVVNVYANSIGQDPQGHPLPYTISAIDLQHVDAVAAAMDNLAQALRIALPTQGAQIQYGRNATQKFPSTTEYQRPINNQDAYLDLYNFAAKMITYVPNNSVQTAAQQLQQQIGAPDGNFIIAERHRNGYVKDNQGVRHYWEFINVSGVSIYFPSNGPGWPDYMDNQFQFTTVTVWKEFLLDYFDTLGLPPQPVPPPFPPPILAPGYGLYLPTIIH